MDDGWYSKFVNVWLVIDGLSSSSSSSSSSISGGRDSLKLKPVWRAGYQNYHHQLPPLSLVRLTGRHLRVFVLAFLNFLLLCAAHNYLLVYSGFSSIVSPLPSAFSSSLLPVFHFCARAFNQIKSFRLSAPLSSYTRSFCFSAYVSAITVCEFAYFSINQSAGRSPLTGGRQQWWWMMNREPRYKLPKGGMQEDRALSQAEYSHCYCYYCCCCFSFSCCYSAVQIDDASSSPTRMTNGKKTKGERVRGR